MTSITNNLVHTHKYPDGIYISPKMKREIYCIAIKDFKESFETRTERLEDIAQRHELQIEEGVMVLGDGRYNHVKVNGSIHSTPVDGDLERYIAQTGYLFFFEHDREHVENLRTEYEENHPGTKFMELI